jgi:signal transduction histidine kinase
MEQVGPLILPSLSLACGSVCLFVALLLRTAPRTDRFGQLPFLNVFAVAGGLYSLSSVASASDLPADAFVALARVRFVAVAAAVCGLLRYTTTVVGGCSWRREALLLGLPIAGSLLYTVPGVGLTGAIRTTLVPALEVVVASAEQTPLGRLATILLLSPLVACLWLFGRAASRGVRGAATNFAAMLALALVGLHDALVVVGLFPSPQLLPAGITIALLLLAGELARRFGEDSQALDLLSSHLEEQIQEQGKALVDAQERIARAERLALVGRLTSGMAHEINNPIAVLTANVEYLQAAFAGGNLPADAAGCLEETRAAARRVGASVRGLLLVSRAAGAEADGESFQLDPVVTRSQIEAERLAGRTGWLALAVEPGLSAAGKGTLLERLLGELLLAASRCAPPESPARLTARGEGDVVSLWLDCEGPWLPELTAGADGLFSAEEPADHGRPLVVALNLLGMIGARIELLPPPRPGLRLQLPRGRARDERGGVAEEPVREAS